MRYPPRGGTAASSRRSIRPAVSFVSAGALHQDTAHTLRSLSGATVTTPVQPSPTSTTRACDGSQAPSEFAVPPFAVSPSRATTVSMSSFSSDDHVVFAGRGPAASPHPAVAESLQRRSSQKSDDIVYHGRPCRLQRNADAGKVNAGSSQDQTLPSAGSSKESLVTSSVQQQHTEQAERERGAKSSRANTDNTSSSLPTFASSRSETTDAADSRIGDLVPSGSEEGAISGQFLEQRLRGVPQFEVGSTPWIHRSKPGIGWAPAPAEEDAEVALDDYINNVRGPAGAEATQDATTPAAAEHGWDEATLEALEALTTSDDISDKVECVISKRDRRGGVQYLVHYEGAPDDEVHWLPASFLTTPRDVELVAHFEDAHLHQPESLDAFPSASRMADTFEEDPYGGFDIMDRERPSLQLSGKRKGKGKAKASVPDLSDSELDAKIQAVWKADRSKKKAKKQAREQLRAMGILNRDPAEPDLHAKYKDGFSMADIAEEIRAFLMAKTQELRLPPMPQHRRLFVHKFCYRLNISTSSHGDGSQRYTTLNRTPSTVSYNEDSYNRIANGGKFRFREEYDEPGFARGGGRGARAAGKKAAVDFRRRTFIKDGEIVGANAPALGPENRGFAMMVKMGWSKGTALGAHGQGILEPIKQRVRLTRAGL